MIYSVYHLKINNKKPTVLKLPKITFKSAQGVRLSNRFIFKYNSLIFLTVSLELFQRKRFRCFYENSFLYKGCNTLH